MELNLNTWLVGLSVDVGGTEMMVYYLISATDLAHAEAGVLEMGRTWWPALQREDDRHRWEYAAGVVWFNSIILLDDVENSILRGLKFLDAWTVTGSTDMPVLRDEWGNDWRDITRCLKYRAGRLPGTSGRKKDVALLRIHAAHGAGISTARSQCAAPGRTRDGRLFRSCPASL